MISEGGLRVMEISDFNTVAGCPWDRFWEGHENPKAIAALQAARLGRTEHFIGRAKTFKGTERWWSVSVSPIKDSSGNVERILSVSRDQTELVEAKEQQDLLNGELGHRLKNMLAVIQSIASQTFRTARDLPEASESFASRLTSLGEAAGTLTAGAWQSAMLRDVVDAGLTSIEGLRDRVIVDGPAVELHSQATLAMTLALHELATNAVKYGALSNNTGTIRIGWSADHADGQQQFQFRWTETGGPTVSPSTRQGFGSRMIERSLRSYFRGEVQLLFAPTGVEFTIDAPLEGAGTLIKA
jgi:two-component sensor histidine kinase